MSREEKKNMKKTTFKIITLAAILSWGGKAPAAGFDLPSMNAADIRAGQAEINIPVPQTETDDLIGVDMSMRIPFKTLKKAVGLPLIDPSAPVFSKAGDFLKISNFRMDAGGIIVEPTLTLKPYMEGLDKLAIRIQCVQLHASMEPGVKSARGPAVNQEDIMQQVMEVMIKGIYAANNAMLIAKHIPLKAEDVLRLEYDKASWTLRAAVSSAALHELILAGMVGDIHLTGFTFSDTGIALKMQTAE